jgi:hypothetical protein
MYMNGMGAEDLDRAIELEQLRLAHTDVKPLGILCAESARRKGLSLCATEYPFFVGYKDHPAPSHTQLLADEMIVSVRMPCAAILTSVFTIDAKPETIIKAARLLDRCMAASARPLIRYHDAVEYALQPVHKSLKRLLVSGSLEAFLEAFARGNAYGHDGMTSQETLACERNRLMPLLTVRNLGRAIARLGDDPAIQDMAPHIVRWKSNNWIENATSTASLDDELPNRVRLRRSSTAKTPALRLVQPAVENPALRAKLD